MQPDAIKTWASEVRTGSNGGFQLNLWIPEPPPKRDIAAEDAVRDFLHNWGPQVPREAGDVKPPDFSHIARAYGLNYRRVVTREALADALQVFGARRQSWVLEIFADDFG